jgi:hypothetical protein
MAASERLGGDELRRSSLRLGAGRTARVVRCSPRPRLPDVIQALGVAVDRPVIVVNGSTTEPSARQGDPLPAVMTGVAAAAVHDGATLVTGGTDAGVFAELGRALQSSRGPYQCVGVVPAGPTAWRGRPAPAGNGHDGDVALEAHHTHFLVVDGCDWGDETDVMLDLAGELAGARPSVAVLVGGGEIAAAELAGHLGAGRRVVVLAGSGRLADDVAQAVRSGRPLPGTARGHDVRRDLVDVIEVDGPPDGVQRRLCHWLRSGG